MSKLQQLLFQILPIHKAELKKFFTLFTILILSLTDDFILKNIRDAQIVTAQTGGAAMIPFLKIWFTIPFSIIFLILFKKMTKHMSLEKIFYVFKIFFLTFFIIFAWLLLPNIHILEPNNNAYLLENTPKYLAIFLDIYRYWFYAIYYVMANIHTTIFVPLIFWSFTSEVVKLNQAKRFYSLFSLDISGIIAGMLIYFVTIAANKWFVSHLSWEVTVKSLILIVIASSFIQAILYYWYCNIQNNYKKPLANSVSANINYPSFKSLANTLNKILKARYVFLIVLYIIFYEITTEIFEVIWKDLVSNLYPNTKDYSNFMAKVTFITSVLGTCTVLFISRKFLKVYKWQTIALILPIIMFITSLVFFLLLFYKHVWQTETILWGLAILKILVLVGTLQYTLSRIAKHSFFDNSKELALLVIPTTKRTNSRLYTTILAPRIGKLGGASFNQIAYISVGSIAAASIWLGPIIILMIALWIVTIVNISKEYQHRVRLSLQEKSC